MQESSIGRRAFVSAAGLLIARPETVFGSQANSAVEIGIVGCGGRGNWIGKLFQEHANIRIVALADVIRERLEQTRAAFRVEGSRAYHGPKAADELAASKLDAVVIETPVYYHPSQALAAVNAGRHVFLAKPVAPDVPGCNTILEAGRKAKGKVSFLVDFQTRARPVFREAAARIHRGDIGDVGLAQIYYYAGRPAPDRSTPGMDPGLVRIMNWLLDKTLSGDIIVEQNIHVIDLANWYLKGHPVKAYGTGGRVNWADTKFDTGDCWDHFAVTFVYPNGVHADFSSNQLTPSYSSLTVRCFGRKGAADTNYGGLVRITGDNAWAGAEKDDTFTGGAAQNIRDFVAGIHSGDYLNNAESAVESTLTGILGRTAAYLGREVTWEEMLRRNERYEVNLKLDW